MTAHLTDAAGRRFVCFVRPSWIYHQQQHHHRFTSLLFTPRLEPTALTCLPWCFSLRGRCERRTMRRWSSCRADGKVSALTGWQSSRHHIWTSLPWDSALSRCVSRAVARLYVGLHHAFISLRWFQSCFLVLKKQNKSTLDSSWNSLRYIFIQRCAVSSHYKLKTMQLMAQVSSYQNQ